MANVNQVAMVTMDLEKNGRKYQLSMPIGAPYGEAYDATFEFLEAIRDMINAAHAARQQSQPELPKTETN